MLLHKEVVLSEATQLGALNSEHWVKNWTAPKKRNWKKNMFAKLKKKIAEEAATAPRSGVRIPRTISKESITSVGADSGDDFVSSLEFWQFGY